MQYVAWMERQFNACQTPCSMYPSIFNSFPQVPKIAVFKYCSTHLCFPWRRPCDYHAIYCIYLTICTHLFKHFPSYSNRKCKKSPFSRTAAHIFVSPGHAPAIITQCVVWMERQFNACQTPRSIYLSIFNSFRVIRCLSQCITPKIVIFTTFWFPLGTPLGQSC